MHSIHCHVMANFACKIWCEFLDYMFMLRTGKANASAERFSYQCKFKVI